MIKIAIADDNLLLQQSIHEKMDFFGDVTVAFKAVDGEDLLEKLEQNRNVDLILMDIEMPKMNGIQATEAVKNNYPHIKIIMLTVFDNDENIFNAIMAGADGYLLKDL
ncbi:MAG: response regulator transcription factor, partial [Paludibacteraceae bacterium]